MSVAEAYLNTRYEFKSGKYSSHSLLLSLFADAGGGRRVLDVGCAEGFLADMLAQRGYAVTGVDWPGTRHPSSIEFRGANLEDGLGAAGCGFDYILCADVLEHLRDPLRMLLDCRERLASGGALIASLPNSGHLYFRANLLLGRFPQQDRGLFDRTHLHFYMWDGWVDLFARAGFRIESVEPSTVPFGLALPRFAGTPVVSVLERISHDCARVWKRLFAYQFVVVARPEAES
jgi:2-polyprenyl-3-methyl-5-hydroxy-6-metoxy-1,4-benzoquinol methylase